MTKEELYEVLDERLIHLIKKADGLKNAQWALDVAIRGENDPGFREYLVTEAASALAEAYEEAHADVVRRRRELEGPFAA